MMPGNLRIEGKVDELIELLTWPNMKGEKKSMFCFKIFVGISHEWDVLFMFKLFSMSVRDTVLKEELKLHFSKIILILR